MRNVLIVIVGMALAGCEYAVPLIPSPETAIDPGLIGLWQRTDEKGVTQRLLVLALDEHEYMVCYPLGEKAMFARGTPGMVAEMQLVQLKWLGAAAASTPPEKPYQFFKYGLTDDRLMVSALNAGAVTSTDDLIGTIERRANAADLFRPPLTFTKVIAEAGEK